MGTEVDSRSNSLSSNSKRRYRFDAEFFQRSWLLHSLLFPSLFSEQSIIFAALLCVGVANEAIGYYVGLITAGFYLTLGNKDWDGYLEQTWRSLALLLSISFTKTIRDYLQRCLKVSWRKTLTKALHKMYFVNVRYYKLNVLGKQVINLRKHVNTNCTESLSGSTMIPIDNADQRMTSDVELLIDAYGYIFTDLIMFPFIVGYYSWDASGRSGWVIKPTADH